MKVSVVICCFNSESRIVPTLASIARQSLAIGIELDVILVDNNCDDNTVRVAERFAQDHGVALEVLVERVPGPAAARACGINGSSSEYVLFCDDDNWLNEDYIATAIQFLENNPEYAAVGGWGEVIAETPVPEWFERFQTKYACGRTRTIGDVDSLVTAGLLVRRRIWNSLVRAGYKPILSGRLGTGMQTGEDIELTSVIRLGGWKLHFLDELRFKHFMPEARLSTQYLISLAYGHGKSKPVLSEYLRFVRYGIITLPYILLFPIRLVIAIVLNENLMKSASMNTSLDDRVREATVRGARQGRLDLFRSGQFLSIPLRILKNYFACRSSRTAS